MTFLCGRTGEDGAATDELADTLGDLPLALEQAAAYLEETGTSVRDYLRLLGEGELLGLGELTDHPDTVASTWALSLARAQTEAPAAKDLLALCAFLAADDIPRTLPVEHAQLLPEPLKEAATDRLAYNRVVGALGRYSLLTASQDSLAVHRLVQAWVRATLDQHTQRHWAAVAVQLVWAAFPPDTYDPATFPACARLLPHALAATNHASRLAADPEATAGLLTRLGAYLWRRAEPRQARQLFERALAILETRLGPDHPDVARSLNNIGNSLRGNGELPAARTYYERALPILKARLGPDHPDTARVLNNLGAVLGALGDLDAAREAHQRTQAILEAQLGPDHPHRAHALSSLGSVAYQRGDLRVARTYYEQALDVYKARLGADHPDTASTLANLANVLRDLGYLPAARAALERAQAIFEARLDPNHPDLVQTQASLQIVLDDLRDPDPPTGRTPAAGALPLYEARVGSGNPLATTILSNPARIPPALGQSAQLPANDHRPTAVPYHKPTNA